MKKKFSGEEVSPTSDIWADNIHSAKWLSGRVIELAQTVEHEMKTYVHPDYSACEYKMKLNIFTFGKLKLNIAFTVIAPPASVDKSGYCGDLNALIEDYKSRKGLFLILNLKADEVNIQTKAAVGKTLPSCIFKNEFESFDAYLSALRSNYRRRIKIALQKAKDLQVKKIENADFDEEIYKLYLQVLGRSDFPLEKLPIKFFQNSNCEIDVFYNKNIPLAFVMYESDNDNMSFIFGGMDYANRDKYNLYYNMLLHIAREGIGRKAGFINFGQTAEITKCRIGCKLEDRFMIAFGGNGLLTYLLNMFAPFLQNNKMFGECNVFRRGNK